MRRYATGLVLAIATAWMLQATTIAQTTESKTKVKTDDGKAVTYTGCVQTGTVEHTYLLQNGAPVSRTTVETKGTSGTTVTTYALVPESSITFQEHVGQKVEITAVLVPAGKGDTKYTVKTKSKAGEQETKGEIERGPVPQLRVVSVRPLGERC